MMESYWNRREFLQLLGQSALVSSVLPFAGCVSFKKQPDFSQLPFLPLGATRKDNVVLSEGFNYQMLIKWKEIINPRGQRFGYNNDYIAYIPFDTSRPNEGWLWVNHEAVEPLFVSGRKKGEKITPAMVKNEMKQVGGSLLHVRKEEKGWRVVKKSKKNQRWDAFTKIPFANNIKVKGQTYALGTLANCAGGVTPWNTILTCEENYQDCFGETVYFDDGRTGWKPGSNYYMWEKFYKRPPEHYGWVVEIDPKSNTAKKHTNLGRFAHECATTAVGNDGRAVIYSGDDAVDECIYKFISDKTDNLHTGTLYVADTSSGRWLPLDVEKDSRLKEKFKTQLDMLIRTREAAHIVGGTPQNRPEDIQINPANKDVLVCLTNNKPRGDYHGQILAIKEKNADHSSLEFEVKTLKAGGVKSGFSCPDNIAFDPKGNLWMTTDISGGSLGEKPYEEFGNNSLFYIPLSGDNAGFVFRVASAPRGAEFTGPCFSPDGSTLFLSVQHPGEGTKELKDPVSRWPDFGNQLPKPSVITLQGPALDQLCKKI